MPEPRHATPAFRAYESTLPWSWAAERLAAARNFWLATATAERGPHARPVWGVWCGAGLLFTTSPTSRKARDFDTDPRVSVHAELLREVVVVDGVVEQTSPPDADVDAYEAKYAWRPPESQRWYVVRPRRAYASHEDAHPEDATNYEF
jgi:pyridoxine/pyridoxamine 5'-phosphate oxidase